MLDACSMIDQNRQPKAVELLVRPLREVAMTDDRNAVVLRLRLPAASLLAVGLTDAVSAIFIIVSGFFTGMFRLGPAEGAIGVLALVASGVIILGARRMGQTTGLWLAIIASFLAMIPCLSPCFFIGLPVGIWSLVVLSAPDVKSAFR
jgi:hypothetical protein